MKENDSRCTLLLDMEEYIKQTGEGIVQYPDNGSKPMTKIVGGPQVGEEVHSENSFPYLDEPSQEVYAIPEDNKVDDIPCTDIPSDQQRPSTDLTSGDLDNLVEASFSPNLDFSVIDVIPPIENPPNEELPDTKDITQPPGALLEILSISSKLNRIRELPITEKITVSTRNSSYPWIEPDIPKEYDLITMGEEIVSASRKSYGILVNGTNVKEAWNKTKDPDGRSRAASLPDLLRAWMANDLDSDVCHTDIASGSELIMYVTPEKAEGLVLVTHGASLLFSEMERHHNYNRLISEVTSGFKLPANKVINSFNGIFPGMDEKVKIYDLATFMAATQDAIVKERSYGVVMTLEEAANCPCGNYIDIKQLKFKPLVIALFGGIWLTHYYFENFKSKTKLNTHGFHHPFTMAFDYLEIVKNKAKFTGRKPHYHRNDRHLIDSQGWPVYIKALGSGDYKGIESLSGLGAARRFAVPLLDEYWTKPSFDLLDYKGRLYNHLCSSLEVDSEKIKGALDSFFSPNQKKSTIPSRLRDLITSRLRSK